MSERLLPLEFVCFLNKEYYEILRQHSKANTNYRRGTSFERRVVNFFRKRGMFSKRNWGSQGTRISGKSFQDDGFTIELGYVWTAKWSKSHATKPTDHPEECQLTKELAKMFGLIPLFAGVKANRRMYFVNLNTMEEVHFDD